MKATSLDNRLEANDSRHKSIATLDSWKVPLIQLTAYPLLGFLFGVPYHR